MLGVSSSVTLRTLTNFDSAAVSCCGDLTTDGSAVEQPVAPDADGPQVAVRSMLKHGAATRGTRSCVTRGSRAAAQCEHVARADKVSDQLR